MGTVVARPLQGTYYSCLPTDSIKASVSCMLENAEDELFHKIISNSQHVLQSFLTDRAEVSYNLTSRKHNKTLIPKTVDLSDRHFLIRCLYKCNY